MAAGRPPGSGREHFLAYATAKSGVCAALNAVIASGVDPCADGLASRIEAGAGDGRLRTDATSDHVLLLMGGIADAVQHGTGELAGTPERSADWETPILLYRAPTVSSRRWRSWAASAVDRTAAARSVAVVAARRGWRPKGGARRAATRRGTGPAAVSGVRRPRMDSAAPGVRAGVWWAARAALPTVMAGVPARTFALWQVAGGAVWTVGLVLGGYALGTSVPNVDRYLLPVVAVIVAGSLLPPALGALRSRRSRITAEPTAGSAK
ncbi:hypothetical protein SANTM175S_06520 [Streptomyces antimycoticus]